MNSILLVLLVVWLFVFVVAVSRDEE